MSLAASLACQSKQLYPGTARPPSEVAVIERESGRGIVRFQAVDGVEVKGSGFHVLPGEHQVDVVVRVQVTLDSGGVTQRVWANVPCRAVFVAKAGRTYFVRGDVLETGRGALHRSFVPQLWVADREVPQLDVAEHVCQF